MDLRGLKQKPWRVVEDASGRRKLDWVDQDAANDDERTPLERLDTAELELVDDVRVEQGYDPYDSGIFSIKGSKFYDRSHGKRSAFSRLQRGK